MMKQDLKDDLYVDLQQKGKNGENVSYNYKIN